MTVAGELAERAESRARHLEVEAWWLVQDLIWT